MNELEIEALLEEPVRRLYQVKRDNHADDRDGKRYRSSEAGDNRDHRSRYDRSEDRRDPYDRSEDRRDNRDRSYNQHERRDVRDQHGSREVRDQHDRQRKESFSDATRDRRTVFVRQLAQRVREADLRGLFEGVGPVHEVKLVVDRKSGRSKGVAFVEFEHQDSIYRAIGLTGTVLAGIPVIVEITETEKNRLAEESAMAAKQARDIMSNLMPSNVQSGGVTKLKISSLHPHLGESEIRAIFEPFGEIVTLSMHRGDATQCYAILSYRYPGDAQMAIKQMDGFDLAGNSIQVAPADGTEISTQSPADPLLRVAREAASLRSQTTSVYLDLSIGMNSPDLIRSEILKYGQIINFHVLDGRIHVQMGNQMAAERAITAFAAGSTRVSANGRFMSPDEWSQLYSQNP